MSKCRICESKPKKIVGRFYFNAAGLICYCSREWALHFLVKPKYWVWGYKNYDDSSVECGFGPLFYYIWGVG